MKRAFTLIELSIVLIIIGLLVGGVLAGQDLIRQAQLRKVVSEYQEYVLAVNVFKQKYDALPGDMDYATDIWGQEATCPGGEASPSTTSATCDGNDNGIITWGAADTNLGEEAHRFWQHLSNAGFVAEIFSGVHGPGGCNGNGSCNAEIGTSAPASALNGAGWSISTTLASNYVADIFYNNLFFFGTQNNFTTGAVLTPQEAFSVDEKMDDGQPGYGVVFSMNNSNSGSGPDCVLANDVDTSYDLAQDTVQCALIFNPRF